MSASSLPSGDNNLDDEPEDTALEDKSQEPDLLDLHFLEGCLSANDITLRIRNRGYVRNDALALDPHQSCLFVVGKQIILLTVDDVAKQFSLLKMKKMPSVREMKDFDIFSKILIPQNVSEAALDLLKKTRKTSQSTAEMGTKLHRGMRLVNEELRDLFSEEKPDRHS